MQNPFEQQETFHKQSRKENVVQLRLEEKTDKDYMIDQ